MRFGASLSVLLMVCMVIFSLSAGISKAQADVSLPQIFSDNMVVQQNQQLKIWGWASEGERVTVSLNNQTTRTLCDRNGNWQVQLKPMPAGGPYTMTVQALNKIELKNILIGEVWICSGQSNMEWTVQSSNNPDVEIANADYPEIRLFTVGRVLSSLPKEDLPEGAWQICSPATVGEFSAVAYYFGRELNKSLGVPIGLINTSWGGTVSETWTSREAMEAFPEYSASLAELAKFDIEKRYESEIKELREGLGDLGIEEKWFAYASVPTDWPTMTLPQRWELAGAGLEQLDGIVWFMKEIILTAEEVQKEFMLHLGQVDNTDNTYLNGIHIGMTEKNPDKVRTYSVGPGILKSGKNLICVRVTDYAGGGGIWGDKDGLYYKIGDYQKVSLAGAWSYQIGRRGIPKILAGGPNLYPTLLYNGMIHPLISFTIKGAIWYQGESNVPRAYQYRDLFPAMISDWRKQWDQGDFPFLFVQLANFKNPAEAPGESDWAELREAQLMALNLPNTGMAVTIDIGEADNIHPGNKQEVGIRLAQNAKKIAHGQDIVFTGPLYKSMEINGDKIRIKFDHTGSGLVVKDHSGYLKDFAIAGQDKRFVWAQALVEGNDVIVSNKAVRNPVAVRYGWADNPADVNLYNKEGYPASPFRSDDWPGVTEGKK